MVTAILSQDDTDLNSPSLNTIDEPGEVVLRFGLNGSASIQIFAGESSTQDLLHGRLTAALPLLEQLHEVMSTNAPKGDLT